MTRQQFVRAAKKAGAVVEIAREGIHYTIRITAPQGMRFAGYDFHETVVHTFGAYNFDMAMDDLKGGFEVCDEPECEWCLDKSTAQE